MATGYVVAAFLETAGLIGLMIAAFQFRTERLAKVEALRSFVRLGQIAARPEEQSRARGRAGPGRKVVAVPFVPVRSPAQSINDTPARSALERALARGRNGRAMAPLSAG